jgi:flagellar biosynthesis/type III secretory pathway chaperone
MPSLISELIDTLNNQAENYENLLGLSLEKKDVIIKNSIDELKKITELENIIVSRNAKLEKTRVTLTDDIESVLGQETGTMTLGKLVELTDGQPENEALKEARERIMATAEKLKDANDQNAVLLTNALDYIEFTLNLVQSTADQSPDMPERNGKGAASGDDGASFFDMES